MIPQKFFDLFTGLNRVHGVYELSNDSIQQGQKMGGRALTVQEPVTVKLWAQHLEGKRGLGVVPIDDNSECTFGAIDIDDYNLDISLILKTIAKNHLPLVACNSKSGGLHLYLFTREKVPAALIRQKLKDFARVLEKEDTEIFPKQSIILSDRGDIGNWLNMPYFGDTRKCVVLNQRGNYVHVSAEQFLEMAEQSKLSIAELKAFTVNVLSTLTDGPPCLERLLKQGGFFDGMRNEAVSALCVYLKQSQPNTWQTLIDSYNTAYVHPPLGSGELQNIVKSMGRKNYHYRCDVPPLSEYCDKVKCAARKFGEEAAGLPQLSGLSKVETSPATWFINVNDNLRIELSTEDLQNQGRFQRVCLETVNILTPVISPKKWRNLLTALLEELTIIQVSDDLKPEGRFIEHLEYFCTVRAPARSKSEILLGKAWTDNGKHYFRARDLLQHLERQRFKELTAAKITLVLRKIGGKSEVLRIQKKNPVRVWAIPAFKLDDEGFDTPNIEAIDGGVL